jgi:hypothetical protein
MTFVMYHFDDEANRYFRVGASGAAGAAISQPLAV